MTRAWQMHLRTTLTTRTSTNCQLARLTHCTRTSLRDIISWKWASLFRTTTLEWCTMERIRMEWTHQRRRGTQPWHCNTAWALMDTTNLPYLRKLIRCLQAPRPSQLYRSILLITRVALQCAVVALRELTRSIMVWCRLIICQVGMEVLSIVMPQRY